jgi:O-antigen ligase
MDEGAERLTRLAPLVKGLLLGSLVGIVAGLVFGAGQGQWLLAGLGAVVFALVTKSRPDLAVGGLILALPLIGDRALASVPGLPDITVGRLLIVWTLGVVISAISRQQSERPSELETDAGQGLVLGRLALWIGIFLSLMLLASLRNPSLQTGLQSWLDSYLLPFGSLLIVTRYRWSSRETDSVVTMYLVCCGLWSVLAVVESRTGRSLFTADGTLPWASSGASLARAGGPFINPAFLGTAIGIGLVLAWVWAGRGGLTRRVALTCMPIAMMGLAVTLTRASWLAAVAGILVVLATTRHRRFTMVAIVASGLTIGLLVMVSLVGATFLESRATSTSEIFNRVIVQRAAVSIIADHPLIGVGSDRFATMSRGDLRNVGAISGSFGVGTLVPHNSVLGTSVDGGLVAGASLIVVFGILVVAARRLLAAPAQHHLGMAALGCTTVFAINAMFIDIFLGAGLATLSLTVIGILLSSRGRQDEGA